MRVIESADLLDAHLNAQWLRPESALWDAIASLALSGIEFRTPSLDLGSGNGLFSFITAGGRFSPDYDWYRNVRLDGSATTDDPYDTFVAGPSPAWIVQPPSYQFDCALDAKSNLLRQAATLGFYRETIAADANHRLPFPDDTFQTVFSNMLYWLDAPEIALQEVRRILRPVGRAVVCVPDPEFLERCASYRWEEQRSELLRLLNGDRRESLRWTASSDELARLAARTGLTLRSDTRYLSPTVLQVWDIGLRPFAPVLLRMVGRLSDPHRLDIKTEWIETVRPFLRELYERDQDSREPGGYHCVELEKR